MQFTRRTLLSFLSAVALAGATSAFAQPALPFQPFDTHVHFVSNDLVHYPMRTDPAPNEHERDMREYIRANPTYAQRIFSLWDAQHVEGGVAVQYRTAYNTDNSYVVDTGVQNPARVASVVILDAADPQAPAALRKLAKEKGVAGIRLTGSKDKATGEFPWLDSAAAKETWKVANELGLAVVLMPGPVYQVNPEAMERIAKLADAFPNTDIVLDHFTWPAPEGAPDYGLSAGHVALRNHKNVYYKFTTLNSLSLEKAHVSSAEFLRHAVKVYGADHIMWGSDTGNNKLQYEELMRRGLEAITLLSPDEQRKVMRDTGKQVFIRGGRGAQR